MKSFVATLLCWCSLVGYGCYGQAPDWKVDPSAFSHSMTVVGVIKVDKQEARSANDKVAAFINGECRGVATASYQKDLDRYLVYLLVYNNGGNETVSFQFFSAERNQAFNTVDSFPFVVDSLAGGVDLPYIWSNVVLHSQAEITSFSLPGQLYTTQFGDSSLYLSLSADAFVTSAAATFQLSEGASLYHGLQRQVSGVTTNDFSLPVKYTVQSEDGKHLKTYWTKTSFVMGTEPPATPAGSLLAYPNPTAERLFVRVAGQQPSIQVNLMTTTGQRMTKTSVYKDSAGTYQFDLSDVAPGLYLVAVNGHPALGVKRIVVR